MRLKDIKQVNETFIPPAVAAFAGKYGAKVLGVIAIAVLEKIIEKLLKKFYINKQDNLPKDRYYMGFGYSTKVPRNEFTHAEMIGGALRRELEKKIGSDFSLYQATDMTKMIKTSMKSPPEDKDIFILNQYLFGFIEKPNMKDLKMKLIAAFKKLNIEIKITYYGKK